MIDTRAEIMKCLRATPTVLRALLRDLDDGQLRARPATGAWAIVEVVGHIADTEERALGRVRLIVTETDPWIEPFDQEALAESRHYIDLDAIRELERFDDLRKQHLQALETLDDGGWKRTGRHGQHGEISIELYETHVAAEEVDHLAQIAHLILRRNE